MMIICKVPDRKRVRVGTSTPIFLYAVSYTNVVYVEYLYI